MGVSSITIVEYRDDWPREFERIAGELRGLLGDLAVRIDHVGSTAVPGLAAKDRIDVQVGIADTAQLDAVAARLVPLGWTHHPMQDRVPPNQVSDDEEWRKAVLTPPPGARPANVHVRVVGRANWRYALLFRDYLRTDPAMADAYANVKRAVAAESGGDIATYADRKDPMIDRIAAAAEAWAASTGWAPPSAA